MIDLILLGIIQGLTEFLPISSSGHLVLFGHLLKFEGSKLAYTALLHLGTNFSLIFFFRKRLWKLVKGIGEKKKKEISYLIYIFIGSIPIVLTGLFLREEIEKIFNSLVTLPYFFFATGIILVLTKFFGKDKEHIDIKKAFTIGIFQAMSVLPGISRSGFTVSSAIFLNIKKEEAFTFSFLLSIPTVFGANILEFVKGGLVLSIDSITGILIAFGSGVFALWLLKKSVITWKFWTFSFYCIGIATLLIFLLYL